MTKPLRKILILDGIGGVPLGREICTTFVSLGVDAVHLDCLKQRKRVFYGIRSIFAKTQNRNANRESFFFLPKLVEKDLTEFVHRERPSHILVIGFAYKFYGPVFLRSLARTYGSQLFLYDTDSCNLYSKRREFIFFVENELPVYDCIFSFSKVTTHLFSDTLGLNAVHFPFGSLPITLPEDQPESDVLFVGSCDLRRIILLEGIRKHVTVRGNRWQRNYPLISPELNKRITDEPVWGTTLYGLLGGAKIVLNITRSDFYGAETGVNLRIFEALAAGCFLLTDHCDEVEALFKSGIEIETFRSSSELIEKVDYYLTNDAERERIAQRGHEIFKDRYSWRERINNMITLMEDAPNE